MLRRLPIATVALAAFLSLLPAAPAAARKSQPFLVTFAARECPTYESITANRARNNIQESLKDLGADTPYKAGQAIDPAIEDKYQPACKPITDWRFTLGTGYKSRAVTGPWGSLSIVTGAYSNSIVTKASTPLLNTTGGTTGANIKGAVTVELSSEQANRAAKPNSLWTQGGTTTDPVLDQQFPSQYGFGALRCAIDNLNGDNVEWISYPQGFRHVFCYAYYVKPPPTSGTIIVRKQVNAPPGAASQNFRFEGNISYATDQSFTLTAAPGKVGSETFYRAATGASDQPWNFQEIVPPGWRLDAIDCTSQSQGSTISTNVSTAATAVRLGAGDTVTCTYTDTFVPPVSGLQLAKTTINGVGKFGFDVRSTSGEDGGTATATTTEEQVPVLAQPALQFPPGSYTIDEDSPSSDSGRWKLTEVLCNDVEVDPDLPVRVNLAAGQGTLCSFTNEFKPDGRLKIHKVTFGKTATTGFVITPAANNHRSLEQSATTVKQGVPALATGDDTSSLPLGTYIIQETTPTGSGSGQWLLDNVSCDGTTIPSQAGEIRVRLTSKNPTLDCTFYDTYSTKPYVPDASTGGDATPSTNLKVTKSASPGSIAIGGIVTYTVRVRNTGSNDAHNVSVVEQIARGDGIRSILPRRYSCKRAGFPSCEVGTIKAGKSVTLTVRAKMNVTGTNRNRVAVDTSTQESHMTDNVSRAAVEVLGHPGLLG